MYGLKHPHVDTHARRSPLRGIIRGVFRTQSRFLAVNYFRQNAPSHMFNWVLNIPLIMKNKCSWNSKM